MLIKLTDQACGGVVARELQFDELEGEFFVAADGLIHYRHQLDKNSWFAGYDMDQFCAAATAWNNYSEAVVTASNSAQEHLVRRLREHLGSLRVLDREDSVWCFFLEQAEHGSL